MEEIIKFAIGLFAVFIMLKAGDIGRNKRDILKIYEWNYWKQIIYLVVALLALRISITL